MPDLASDLRAMMAACDFETGEPRVCVIVGQDVPCLPSRATEVDALNLGNLITAGKTRVLRVVRADAPDIEPGMPVTWNGRTWEVKAAPTLAHGALIRLFLGTP